MRIHEQRGPQDPPKSPQNLPKTSQKLHPCIETLNSRNLGLAKDSFKVSFGFRTLSRPRLIKDTKNVQIIGFTVCSLKNVKKQLVLLCFRSKMLKNHWFYCVFAQKCSKTIGFIVFSWLFRSKTLKNHWFYSVFLTFQAKKWKNHWFYCEKF